MFISYYLLFIMKYIEFIIYDLLLQCFNVGWMKNSLVCGNCLSPTLITNEEGDTHLGLDLPRRSIKLIKDITFLHGPFAWHESNITPTHAINMSRSSKLQHEIFSYHGPHVKEDHFPCSEVR